MPISYLELYCDAANGSNTQPGDNTSAPVVTTNGAYTQGGGAGGTSDRFVAASGTPFAAAVVGQLVAFMADGGTIATSVHRILAVNSSTSIDVGNGVTNMLGTRPTTAANGRTATINGAMKGPNGTTLFPLSLTNLGTFTNANGNFVWVNLKNNASYVLTGAAGTMANGPYGVSGYTTTPRDGGKAVITGGTSGASYQLFTWTPGTFEDLDVSNNGDTGSAALTNAGAGTILRRCVLHNSAGSLVSSGNTMAFEGCEFYAANKNNTSATPALTISSTAPGSVIRCNFHDNAGSNTDGLIISATRSVTVVGCVFDSNGRAGMVFSTNATAHAATGCDFYNNGKDGVEITGNNGVLLQNCNFAKNVTGGVDRASGNGTVIVSNCGFGTGADANGTDIIGVVQGNVEGSVTYTNPTNPWKDPANGDFTIVSAQAKGTGRGTFTATAAGYTGQTGYPDIGAAQHREPGRVF